MRIVGILVLGLVGLVLLLLIFSLASNADGTTTVRAVSRMAAQIASTIARTFGHRGGDGPTGSG